MRKLIFSAPVARGALMEFFALGNWTYTREYEPDDDDTEAHEIEWTQADGQNNITYCDDFAVQLGYLVLESDTKEQENVLETDVRRGPFLFHTTESILANFDSATTPEETIEAFAKLVIGAPEEYDERFLLRIKEALHHVSPYVRAECLDLLPYVSWHEILPLVMHLRADPDGTVRHNATVISDEFRALGLG
jgi:hypothetical protein